MAVYSLHIKQLLRSEGIHPAPKMGQNFIVSSSILRKLSSTVAQLCRGVKSPVVVEIGAGIGNYTEFILEEGLEVISIEKDSRLASICMKRLKNRKNFHLLVADILEFPFSTSKKFDFNVVVTGNIPFSITSPVLGLLTRRMVWAQSAFILLQQEVAERITARAGSRKFGSLTVFLNIFWDIAKGFKVGKKNFYPTPAVDSVNVIFRRKEEPPVSYSFIPEVECIAKAIFSYRRKKLSNVFSFVFRNSVDYKSIAQEAGIELCLRPEEIDINLWQRFFELLEKTNCPGKNGRA